MLDRLAGRSGGAVASSYREQAEEARGHAGRIRDLLAERHPAPAPPDLLDPAAPRPRV